MNKESLKVLVADPRELEIARQHYEDYFAHKIGELRKFLARLGLNNITEEAVVSWLTENEITDCGLKTLLLQEIKAADIFEGLNKQQPEISKGSSKLLRCRRIINARYKVELVEQYKHLIEATLSADHEKGASELNERSLEDVVRRGLWINGKKIHLDSLGGVFSVQDILAKALNVTGLESHTTISFLNSHISRCCEKASKYFSDMIDDLNLLLGHDVNKCLSTYLEYDRVNYTILLYVVESYRDLYELGSDRRPRDYTGDHTQDNNSPIIAQSTVKFNIKQIRSYQCQIEFLEGYLEFYDPNKAPILLDRLDSRCSENLLIDEKIKPLLGKIPDHNDTILIDNLVSDCLGDSGFDESDSALKIFLLARKNENFMLKVLQDYKLLKCICSNSNHRQYLELLKFSHCRNSLIGKEISTLNNLIELVNEKKIDHFMDFDMIKDYFCSEYRYKLQYVADDKPRIVRDKNTILVKKQGRFSLEYSLAATAGEDSGEFVSSVIPVAYTQSIYRDFEDSLDDEKIKPLLPIVLELARKQGHLRLENPLYIIAALHTRKVSQIPGLVWLVQDDKIRAQLQIQWVLDLALESWEITSWLVKSRTILNSEFNSQELCKLLKYQPQLWNEIQSDSEERIYLLLRKRVSAENLGYMLFKNIDLESLESAKKALCRDPELFHKLCSLKESYPNELLRYFYESQLDYRIAWENQFKACEFYLLLHCDAIVIEGYYRHVFRKLDPVGFCNVFETVFVKKELLNGSQMSVKYAKKAWVRLLEARCQKSWAPNQLYDSKEKVKAIIGCVSEEPRLICLFKVDSMITGYLNTEDRQNISAFIRLYMDNFYKTEFSDAQCLITALGMLSTSELKEFFCDVKNCRFFTNLLIKNFDAVDILISAKINVDSKAISNILTNAYPQLLLLLLITLSSKETLLQERLLSSQKAMAYTTDEESSLTFSNKIQKQFEYVKNLRARLLSHRESLASLLEADDCPEIDLACLLIIEPTMSANMAEYSSEQKYQKKIQGVNEELRAIKEAAVLDFNHDDGLSFAELNKCISTLKSLQDNEKLRCLFSYILIRAFNNNDFASMIISSPSLMIMLVEEADLFLLAKFICLYGRLNDFSVQWLPFFCRLANHQEIYKIFGSLIHFHFQGAGKDRNHLIKVSLEQDYFKAQDYMKLLLSEYQKKGTNWYREWLLRSDWLERMVADAIPEDLVIVLIEEIKIRTRTATKSFSAIEECLRKEHLLKSILQHTGRCCLIELLQIDSTFASNIIKFCRSTIMQSVESDLRAQVIQVANLEQLIYLIGSGADHPEAVRSCILALRGIIDVNEAHTTIMLQPVVLLNLLLISERVDPNKKLDSEWGRLLSNDQSVCQHLLNKNNPQALVIQSATMMFRYFARSTSLIRDYLDQYKISYEALLFSNIDISVDFLLTDYCVVDLYERMNEQCTEKIKEYKALNSNYLAQCQLVDIAQKSSRQAVKAMKEEFTKTKEKLDVDIRELVSNKKKFSKIIFRLFLECNEVQLQRFSIPCYVDIFIHNIDKYLLDYKSKQCVVVPRLTSALVYLSERNHTDVLRELLSNRFLLDLIVSSPSALCLLVSSPLYRQSEELQNLISYPKRVIKGSSENSPLPLKERPTEQPRSDSFASVSSHVSAMVYTREREGLNLKKSGLNHHSKEDEHSSEHSKEKSM